MSSYDLILTGAQVYVSSLQKFAAVNLGISNSKIVQISAQQLSGETEISLKGLHILPGVIDTQVHFREPGLTHKEDLETGTHAAALGGVTSLFEMPNTNPSTTDTDSFNEKLRLAQGRAHVNYAFYIGGTAENIPELSRLEKLPGCPGVKVFMGSSTGNLLVENDSDLERLLLATRKRSVYHCEDEVLLRERKSIAVESQDVVRHPDWRNAESSFRATNRLLRLARQHGKKVHVLHVTTAQEMQLLKQNKDLATVEVTPQHLSLFAPDCYERLGSFAQMNPPIREKNHQQALWAAIHDGTVDVIGSDHAPHTREEKSKTYPGSPSGMPGVQTLLPLMLDHVANGKLSLEKLVQLTSENAARIFSIKDRGQIKIGCFADLTIVDLNRSEVITRDWLKSRCDWSPFEGQTVQGWPVMTVINGEVVMREAELVTKGHGHALSFSN